MQGPRENPEDRADRERERRLATKERRDAAQQTAADLTQDLSSVYGVRAMSMFAPRPRKSSPVTPTATPRLMDR